MRTLFRQLSIPGRPSESLCLKDYFSPDTFIFTLMHVDDRLEARRCPNDPSLTRNPLLTGLAS